MRMIVLVQTNFWSILHPKCMMSFRTSSRFEVGTFTLFLNANDEILSNHFHHMYIITRYVNEFRAAPISSQHHSISAINLISSCVYQVIAQTNFGIMHRSSESKGELTKERVELK